MAGPNRETIDRHLQDLTNLILELAILLEQAVLGSVQFLLDRDIAGAK